MKDTIGECLSIVLFTVLVAFMVVCMIVGVCSIADNRVHIEKEDLIKAGHASYVLDSLTGKTNFVLDSTFLKEKR